ncbi:WXG100 family type VII secretion target [Actinospongicola halichondriae]|uniref:WXG100 family type VII secretion target n=1 Tax=Actinospongicola halichondriae TaxID=3236844 RepID=UPI003D3E5998
MSGADLVFVEPEQLRAAASEVLAADRALEGAGVALDAADGRVRAGIDHDGRADDKVSTFVRQWRSEFDLLRQMMNGFADVLDRAAECYEELDAELASCIR